VFDSLQKRQEVVLPALAALMLGLWLSIPEKEHEPPPLLWEDTAPPEIIPEPAEDFAQHCDIEPPPDFNRMVEAAGEATGINPRLIALTVYRESRCKVDALGAVGEIGLGQVYPDIWTQVLVEEGIIESVGDLYDPEVNLRATGFILSEVLRYAKGDPADALRRYNGSGSAARRYAREQSGIYQAMWGEPVWFRR
jgi:soluble lytic murein transglycosylase-like protein